ncbi:hypothetical protein [Actinokineospora globicatena]|uniref:Uncharacterized protein n=1 Tax=Actinokineospora globicatena TaxID=103729 RepID=A0A9W6QP06_9PSEU|nr:hypothetical protein [Actinokineospora globicatena]MCP2301198.1 hypothetical protein [Actinokineospora globicatena]GLW77166.1 hypothetical protein Aglo01_16480 [Actinokineospora globicatena]GLW84000.1 hypothetical protein Aglo02_16400 [Actinokineospora globicatena]GLW92054.1 hypothetical protein Aglo03_28700 [Actinokineospora globicatena]
MQWQDTLRDLDDLLASGEIDAAEHRRLRDEALAEASGTTRRVPIPSSAFLPRRELSPPRALDQGDRGRFVDGEALFIEPAGRFSRVALGVIAAAVVGASVWWFTSGDSEPAPVAAPPPPTANRADELAKGLPKLPGTVRSQPSVLPVSVGPQLGLYGPEVPNAGSSGLVNAASTDGPRALTVNVLDNGSGPDRAKDILAYAAATGWASDTAPEGVQIVRTGNGGTQLYRAVYRSGTWTVLVTATSKDDDVSFRAYFDSVLARTLLALPAR